MGKLQRKQAKSRATILVAALVWCAGCGQSGEEQFMTQKNGTPEISRRTGSQPNRLAGEKSPYLLQHADNPVAWYPWGTEAFELARRLNKPIFLSIGYSTCHWCHVMEHESFEDPEVAALLNDAFVCIKVDREERPDIDNLYMTVCQMLTGAGGWPLTIVMTPGKKPFFAGTYFPKKSRLGRIGMMDLIPQLKQAWDERGDEVAASANQITAALGDHSSGAAGEGIDLSVLDTAFEQLAESHDIVHGGFGRAPKFPTPHSLMFLLRHWHRTGKQQARDMVERTLYAMRRGGIFDQVGFGFHRYATDREWLVPHFEKMLYDQALIVMAYAEAYQATQNPEYRDTAEKTITYVLRDLTSPEGAFYTAEDADSEGVEGKFYVWTAGEIESVLGEIRGKAFSRAFGIEARGNYADEATGKKTGKNILHVPPGETASVSDLEKFEPDRAKLFAAREKRIHPFKDDKILTDWNGLMIASLAMASRAFDEPRYARAAEQAAGFILDRMADQDGALLHRFRDREAGVRGGLDDYAFMVWALLELYETTFDVKWLKAALDFDRKMNEDFRDEAGGGFFLASRKADDLLIRQKTIYDGAVPSGNSIAVWNMLRLGRITGDPAYEERASSLMRAFAGNVERAPSGQTMLLCAVGFGIGPSFEVVISGTPGADDTEAMIRALRQRFIPNKVVLLRPSGSGKPEISALAEFTAGQQAIGGKATAYVCRNHACAAPTTSIEEMLKLLE
ncbi:MAG: thioredoxin domain-containing protein [Kiritimatiellia bacterium]